MQQMFFHQPVWIANKIAGAICRIKMNIKALDIVTPVIGGIILTVIACERGREPNWFYCVDEFGNGDWFSETEIRIAKSSDLKK